MDAPSPEDSLSFSWSAPRDSRVSCLLPGTLEAVLVLGLPAGLLGVHGSTRLCRSERTFALAEQRGVCPQLFINAGKDEVTVCLASKKREGALTCWSLPLVSHRDDFEVFVELCLFIFGLLIELQC